MSYYTDVYLKRINKDGFDRQDRIKTKKEREFDKIFLKQSEYRAKIIQVDSGGRDINCSIQPAKWNESKRLSNILISTSNDPFTTGTQLVTVQKIKDITYNKIYLVLFCNEDITKGYYLYKCIELDSEINFTNEYGDTQFIVPAKFYNSTEALVNDTYILTAKAKGYREIDREMRFLAKDSGQFKKDMAFKYKNKDFYIEGIDNISIDGVACISIKEKLVKEYEPRSSEEILVSEDTNFFLNNR